MKFVLAISRLDKLPIVVITMELSITYEGALEAVLQKGAARIRPRIWGTEKLCCKNNGGLNRKNQNPTEMVWVQKLKG